MNWKLVLRIYGNLRQLTDDESALLSTLRAMNDTERELLVESLQPQKPAGKRAAKKSAGKSRKAASLGEAVKGNLQRREPTVGGFADDVDHLRCTSRYDNAKGICNEAEDNPIHDPALGYGGYHEFVPPAQSAAANGD